jgi:putative zinc finger protein
MTCRDAQLLKLAERSVRGRLGEEERAAFELHLLECASCYQELRILLAVQAAIIEA